MSHTVWDLLSTASFLFVCFFLPFFPSFFNIKHYVCFYTFTHNLKTAVLTGSQRLINNQLNTISQYHNLIDSWLVSTDSPCDKKCTMFSLAGRCIGWRRWRWIRAALCNLNVWWRWVCIGWSFKHVWRRWADISWGVHGRGSVGRLKTCVMYVHFFLTLLLLLINGDDVYWWRVSGV